MAYFVPFHIPSITKPQIQYNYDIDNSNKPYLHPDWLSKSQDGSNSVLHPVEAFFPLDFVSCPPPTLLQPLMPPTLEATPFYFIDNVDGLNYLASKLELVSEFAVDLEHNSYRSFQGLTCLMQISTRTEDFVVDTLKLRQHIGQVLGVYFLDSDKRKIMHGADNDMNWLQRDFNIYVCNLFDTMQASRVLKTERNTLGFLLKHFCGVQLNKLYNSSDWRLRPLPCEMMYYAREDTHYLLYLYDLIRLELESQPAKLYSGFDNPLQEAYWRSYEVCKKLYEKEVFDKETSYMHLYGLEDAKLGVKQMAIVAGLCEWRDRVGREEDESTGYVLPNKQVLKMARSSLLPFTSEQVIEIFGHDKEFVVRDADLLLEIIWTSVCINAHKLDASRKKQEEVKKSVDCSRAEKEEVKSVAAMVLPQGVYYPAIDWSPTPGVAITTPGLVGYSCYY